MVFLVPRAFSFLMEETNNQLLTEIFFYFLVSDKVKLTYILDAAKTVAFFRHVRCYHLTAPKINSSYKKYLLTLVNEK